MKSLVVNCSLDVKSKNEELLGAIEKFSQFVTVRFEDIHTKYEVGGDIDALILSGSKARIIHPSVREKFKGTIDLVKRIDLPTLGICYGHQLLCWSLGAEVAPHPEKIKQFEEIRIAKFDEIFAGFEENQTIPLAQHHKDYVIKASLQKAKLILLADSKSCEVEAIKHQRKPFYGVQFHPERIKINSTIHREGLKIIENFYKNIVKR
jgi:GMP synthase-like glutamine amidotransferase